MPVRIGLTAGEVRKRWRQRKAVLTATPHRSAEATTVSPSLSDRPKSSQHSFFRNRRRRAGQRVEAPAASLAPEPPQSLSAWPQPPRGRSAGSAVRHPGLVSITAVTAAREGRPASTSIQAPGVGRRSGRPPLRKPRPKDAVASITNSLNTRRILPWVAVPT